MRWQHLAFLVACLFPMTSANGQAIANGLGTGLGPSPSGSSFGARGGGSDRATIGGSSTDTRSGAEALPDVSRPMTNLMNRAIDVGAELAKDEQVRDRARLAVGLARIPATVSTPFGWARAINSARALKRAAETMATHDAARIAESSRSRSQVATGFNPSGFEGGRGKQHGAVVERVQAAVDRAARTDRAINELGRDMDRARAAAAGDRAARQAVRERASVERVQSALSEKARVDRAINDLGRAMDRAKSSERRAERGGKDVAHGGGGRANGARSPGGKDHNSSQRSSSRPSADGGHNVEH
jgi:hypothetical protein